MRCLPESVVAVLDGAGFRVGSVVARFSDGIIKWDWRVRSMYCLKKRMITLALAELLGAPGVWADTPAERVKQINEEIAVLQRTTSEVGVGSHQQGSGRSNV